MKNSIAEIAIPVSISLYRTFDYRIPKDLLSRVEKGVRVLVPFGILSRLGYCVHLKNHSPYLRKLKPIIKVLDKEPLIDKELFDLAKRIQEDCFCSFADALHVVMPKGEMGKNSQDREKTDISFQEITEPEKQLLNNNEFQNQNVLLHDISNESRWLYYSAWIKKVLNEGKSVIFLVPDHRKIDFVLEKLALKLIPLVLSSHLKHAQSLSHWFSIKESDHCFVIGMRSAIFAPVKKLGLIIVEEEDHFAYRQDQVPHYHAREVAFLRAMRHKAMVILGSATPTLETYMNSKEKNHGYLFFESKRDFPVTKVVNFSGRSKDKVISKILEYRLAEFLGRKEKILIFCTQKGFSTYLYCPHCKKVQSCPRCSSSFVYFHNENKVRCPVCGDQKAVFDLCPSCKTAYVRYGGFGMEKVESELLRLFPSLKIAFHEKAPKDKDAYDIMLATHEIFEDSSLKAGSFDMVAAISVDQMMGHTDFRAIEKTFSRLLKLEFLAKTEFVLQTRNTGQYLFDFLKKHDSAGFYKQEYALRRDLKLPPTMRLGCLMIRSAQQSKALETAKRFFQKLDKNHLKYGIEVLGPIPMTPLKIRNNYRYQVLLKYKNNTAIKAPLKTILENKTSGIIATFDPSAL